MGDRSDEQPRKMFLGGLSATTDEQTLRDFFGRFGEIDDCCVIRTSGPHQEKKSRGFGFVTFNSVACVDSVMAERVNGKMTIDGKEVEIKQAMSREDANENPSVTEKIHKVFVGGVRQLSEQQIRDYFSGFGEVKEVVVKNQGPGDQNKKPYAFVIFEDHEVVDKIVVRKSHNINGTEVDCKKAQKQGGQRGGPGGRRNDNGYGGGGGGRYQGSGGRRNDNGYGGGGGGRYQGSGGGYGGDSGGYGGGDFYGGGAQSGSKDSKGGGYGSGGGYGQGGYGGGAGGYGGGGYGGGGYGGGAGGYGGGYGASGGGGYGSGGGGGYGGSGGNFGSGYGSQNSSYGPVRQQNSGGRYGGGQNSGPYGNYSSGGGGYGGGGGGRRY